MGGIIGFGFRRIKYLMCMKSQSDAGKQESSRACEENGRVVRKGMMLYVDGWTRRMYAKRNRKEEENANMLNRKNKGIVEMYVG